MKGKVETTGKVERHPISKARNLCQYLAMSKLSTELNDPSVIPYFLWDEPLTVGQLRQRLSDSSNEERTRLLGKILREARDTDVWKFATPRKVRQNWDEVSKHLGRRRKFWEFLFDFWEREGLLG